MNNNYYSQNYNPDTGVEEYGRGGNIVKALAPAAVGFLTGGAGLPLMASIGLSGLTGYALAGRDRGFLDFVKGALGGYGGASLGGIGSAGAASASEAAAAVEATTALGPTVGGSPAWSLAGQEAALAEAVPFAGIPGPTISSSVEGLGSVLGQEGGLKSIITGSAEGALPYATELGLAGQFIQTPAEMGGSSVAFGGDMSAPTGGMTEEQKEVYLKSLGRTPYTAPNVGIGSTKGPVFAAGGGKIPGEGLESGSFVLPADVVSHAGDGNTNAGVFRLNKMFGGGSASYALGGGVKGPTGGLDDLRQTTIDGKRAAALSDGEYVVPRDAVSRLGGGSNKEGAEKLYNFMKNIRLNKTDKTQQPQNSLTLQGLRGMMA
jgi:hypothetical protein